MRWLLLKDVQILRRSPFLVGMLVLYAVAIPVLIGLALSGGGGKPRVAILNEVPRSDYRIDLGGENIDAQARRCGRQDRTWLADAVKSAEQLFLRFKIFDDCFNHNVDAS